jgi:hypothetical protein
MNYELYFVLLHERMNEYNIEEGNIYNMGEKGFMIGKLSRRKMIFSHRR